MIELRRRDFLTLTAGAMLPRKADAKRRLACNSWPFRAYFDSRSTRSYRDPKYPLLTQAEFPQFLVDQFGIHNVEFLPQHFADTEPRTIRQVKDGLRKANSRCCNLMGVTVPGGVFAPSADRDAIKNEILKWCGVAQALDSPALTIALNGKDPDAAIAAANLSPAVDEVHKRGIKVLFHNDDMKRESAEILTSVIRQLGTDKAGTCPDFGNFAPKSADFALAQVRMLAPYATNICHAKDGIAEHGTFYADDFAGSMRVMRDAGFRGVYSLEFEGLDEPVPGVRKLMELTLENIG